MSTVTLYNTTTGRIVGHLMGSEDFIDANAGDYGVYDGLWDLDDYYVHAGLPVLRPEQEGITYDGVRFHGMPVGGTICVDGDEHVITNEEVEFQFSLPGTYLIKVIDFPHKDWTYEVTV